MELREIKPAPCGCKRFEMVTGKGQVSTFCSHEDATCEANMAPRQEAPRKAPSRKK